jgi:hypothetical protein
MLVETPALWRRKAEQMSLEMEFRRKLQTPETVLRQSQRKGWYLRNLQPRVDGYRPKW